MTVAAIAMAEQKVRAQWLYRVWTRRESLSSPNMFFDAMPLAVKDAIVRDRDLAVGF
jgi:hypothetical protein